MTLDSIQASTTTRKSPLVETLMRPLAPCNPVAADTKKSDPGFSANFMPCGAVTTYQKYQKQVLPKTSAQRTATRLIGLAKTTSAVSGCTQTVLTRAQRLVQLLEGAKKICILDKDRWQAWCSHSCKSLHSKRNVSGS